MLRRDTAGLTVLLGLLTAFGPVATDIYVPSMPAIGQALNTDTSTVQLTLSAYLVAFALGQIIYGPISDRLGRKPVLLAALALFCVAGFACAAAPNIETLITARAFQALGGSGAIVLPRAIVRDLYSGERAGRELSRMGAVMSLAPVVAPLVGAIVQTGLGWRATFLVVIAAGIAAAAIVWRALPETLHRGSAEPEPLVSITGSYGVFAGDRAFLVHLGIIGCSYAGLFAWISGSPFVLQNLYGLSPFGFGVAFAVASVGTMAGGSMAPSVVTRIGLDRTIGLGTLMLTAGGLAMILSEGLGSAPVVALVLSMVLYQVGLMLTLPQAIAGALTPFPERAGAASSLVGLAQQISAAILGTIVGRLVGQSAWPLVGAIALMGALALLLWASSRRLRAQTNRTQSVSRPLANPGRIGGGSPFESAARSSLPAVAGAEP